MNKNNKGFTIIELIVSFSLVMILAFSMYRIVLIYSDKARYESIRFEMETYKNKLLVDIENDISSKGLKKVENCKSGENTLKRCIIITFMDLSQKTLKLQKEVKTDELINADGTKTSISYNSNYVEYGSIKYKTAESKYMSFENEYFLDYSSPSEDVENNQAIYKIYLNMRHSEIEDNFDIRIVAVGEAIIPTGTMQFPVYTTGQELEIFVNTNTKLNFVVIKDTGKYDEYVTAILKTNIENARFASSNSITDYSASEIKSIVGQRTNSWNQKEIREIRLITIEEISHLMNACQKYKNASITSLPINNTLVPWLYSTKYWTMSKTANGSKVWTVDTNGSITATNASVTGTYGIRPVIEISKKYIVSP